MLHPKTAVLLESRPAIVSGSPVPSAGFDDNAEEEEEQQEDAFMHAAAESASDEDEGKIEELKKRSVADEEKASLDKMTRKRKNPFDVFAGAIASSAKIS